MIYPDKFNILKVYSAFEHDQSITTALHIDLSVTRMLNIIKEETKFCPYQFESFQFCSNPNILYYKRGLRKLDINIKIN